MLRIIWRRVLLIISVAMAILGFFALIELIRAYQVLNDLHPWLGIGYVCVLAIILVGLICCYIRSVVTHPKALTPPDKADSRRYASYLVALSKRIDANTRLSDDLRQPLRYRVLELEQSLEDESSAEMALASGSIVTDCIEPCVRELDALAEQEVQGCVRDVMIGVTISPWRAADLLVVLYRNIRMVTAVISIYDIRPTVSSQIKTMVDIAKIVFTVNVLNYGSKLAENLASGIPFVGRFADDIAQGVGAGLFTSMAGHAARERCSCLQVWDEAAAQKRMGAKAKDFAGDLKGIVVSDILPRLKLRLPKDDTADGPGVGERLKAGVLSAMDDTSAVMDAFVKKPAVAAGKSVASTSRSLASWTGRSIKGGAGGVQRAGLAVGRHIKSGMQRAFSIIRRKK